MASDFSDTLMASGGWGWKHPPEISKTTKGMSMKFLPDVGTHIEAQNQKNVFDISGLVCKLQTKVPKFPIFGNANSRHVNFTKFCRIVTIDIKNES